MWTSGHEKAQNELFCMALGATTPAYFCKCPFFVYTLCFVLFSLSSFSLPFSFFFSLFSLSGSSIPTRLFVYSSPTLRFYCPVISLLLSPLHALPSLAFRLFQSFLLFYSLFQLPSVAFTQSPIRFSRLRLPVSNSPILHVSSRSFILLCSVSSSPVPLHQSPACP